MLRSAIAKPPLPTAPSSPPYFRRPACPTVSCRVGRPRRPGGELWAQFAQDRGNEFRDGWVNRHGMLQGHGRDLRVHHIQYPMNGFVAADAQNGGAKDCI